jgi:hypothetical protein
MSDVIVIIINPPPPPPRDQRLGDPDGFAQSKSSAHGCNATPYTVARDMIDEAARNGSRIRIIYEGGR